MELSSSAFADGERIPTKYSCEGEGISPPLSWSGAPEQTQSYAVLCVDPDAPGGTFEHWALYNLAAETTSLPADVGEDEEGFSQGVNDFDEVGYGAPCPPPGDEPHRYEFHVFALEVGQIEDGDGQMSCDEVEAAVRRYVLADATLTGLYDR